MKKITIVVMLFTILSQILGFVRDITLSYFYGTTFFSDAYLISLTITTIVYSFVIIAISTSYTPFFREIEIKRNFNDSIKFTNNIINISLLISVAISIVVFLFANQIVNFVGVGLNREAKDLAVIFTKIGILNIYFTGVVYIFSAFLQLKNKFIMPALIGVPFNIVMILSIYFSHEFFKYSIAFGIALSAFAQFIFLLPFVKKEGFNYRLQFNFRDKYTKKTIYMSLPIILGASISEINVLVIKVLATQQVTGAVSALNYADRLTGFVYGICISSIVVVLFPSLSKFVAENDIKSIHSTIQDALIGITLFVLPASIGFLILNVEIIRLLFGRGVFDENAIELTSGILSYLAIGILGIGYREVYSRVFYAFKDTKTPVINAFIAVLINIILSIILSKYMGVNGLALATSISAYIAAILLTIGLKKKMGKFIEPIFYKSVIKIAFSALVMGILLHFSKSFLTKEYGVLSAFQIIICIVLGVFVYSVMIVVLKIEYINALLKYFKAKKFK